ncbi:MAG: CRISPR-associated helicase Cas3' [Acidobacteria bacterium]|nr:CRISPR-associated helicase Cas3' [Acidobacteriota bacterium]
MRGIEAWGKFEDSSGRFHRLEHHCADVAACFEALLDDPALRARFVRAAGAGEFTETTAARLTFLAYLHDFGKLNVGFQFKVRPRNELPPRAPRPAGHIAEALLCFDQSDFCELLGLHDIVEEWGEGAIALLHAMLAHHGRPARRPTRSGSGPPELWKPFAGYDPRATAKLLSERGRLWFPTAFSRGPRLPDTPALAHLFAGIVALADQLGSDDKAFRYEPDSDPDYIERARRIAADVVRTRGFRRRDSMASATDTDVRDFRSLFDYPDLRPSQRAVTAAPVDQPLLILESETGSGKTEAAILRFAALWNAGLVDGLYFAVPTRAAAKQLHGRVSRALERLFPPAARVETVLAVPGYLVAGDAEGQRVERFDVFWEDKPDEETRLARWSAESARKFLSAPAAVGTVDQVLLAGLRVKWAHFRAAALSRSLLVVDEVHASDAYMTELLLGAMKGHLALGGHALLMSATLGAAARSKFTTRSARSSPPAPRDAEDAPYPALTLVPPDGLPETRAITTSGPAKSVSMSAVSILDDPDSIARTAAAAAGDGARVLVIRNTVSSAQAVFAALLAQGADDVMLKVAEGPALHHSRFAAEDRKLLDQAVESEIGKEAPRSAGGLAVIGTQTLEQSLDIDADLLISDLCPVDVLLQRIGRLHRHAGTGRPRSFRDPQCLVLVPEAGLEDGLGGGLLGHGLGMSDRGGIYRNLVSLEATWGLILEHATWTIPAMNRMLVERATHPELLDRLARELGERWVSHASKVNGRRAAEAGVAKNHALTRNEPFDEDLVFFDLDEHVRTRLGEDGPRIVLAEPVIGPFGAAVQTFNLPAHLFRGKPPGKEEIEAARAVPAPEGGLVLQVGEHRLTYDRAGIRTA